MKELFYFSFADIMTRIAYREKGNTLSYATHRKMTKNERLLIEQYLLATVALKTEYYERQSTLFLYQGVAPELVKALEKFHAQNTQRANEEANATVNELISRSLRNYYFERIGDTLMEVRRKTTELQTGITSEQLCRRKVQLEELVKAYNVYTDQKITVAEIIPSELKSCFGISTENEYLG